jgi:hypothetical protein
MPLRAAWAPPPAHHGRRSRVSLETFGGTALPRLDPRECVASAGPVVADEALDGCGHAGREDSFRVSGMGRSPMERQRSSASGVAVFRA